MGDVSNLTAPEAAAALFNRWRQPAPIDPATGVPVVRPRPILDAIKNGGGALVGQLFTSLGPMLLPFLTKLLNQYMGKIVAPADSEASAALAEDRALCNVLAARVNSEATAAGYDDTVKPIVDALQQFLLAMIAALDPKEAVAWLIELINRALNPTS